MDDLPLQVFSSKGDGSSQQAKPMEPNRLCKRCARALTASKKLWQPRPAGDEPDWESDKFFLSKNVNEMLEESIIAAGCHLCTQVRLEDNLRPPATTTESQSNAAARWPFKVMGGTSP